MVPVFKPIAFRTAAFRAAAFGAVLAAASLACVVAAPAPTASASPPIDPEGTLVAELVVQAREAGPPWWRVSRGASTVYILGVPDGPVPPGIAWDKTVLERRLTGATAAIGPPGLTAGLRDIPAALRMRASLKSKTPMAQGLPRPLAERFAADVARAGKPADSWSDWQPMAAGAFLLRETHGRWAPMEGQVRPVVRRHGLKLESSARYAAMPLAQAAMASLTPAAQQACLAWALDDVEAGEATARRAVQGWARGDVATALTAPRGFDKCLLILTGGGELWSRVSQDQANDIARALDKPGHAVAVVGLRRLLAEGGVIARLEAKGLRVTGPGEP
ncbi:TraB/GumN family protein [Phenylobacterium sp.]|uniref:TraB/GumN family protein n=1 Tax=Phenylobacterium sp. TaxID=1871053 RepID=UPI00374CF400